jgi:glycosyltransferase involved in cell wall biosynthesis
MRILRVAQKTYPDVVGGGPYHVHAMSRDQAAMGHDVTVLTVAHDGTRPHVETRDGYTVVRYPALAAPLGNAISPGLGEFLSHNRTYDVVHAHSHIYFSTNLAALARRFDSTPLAVTNHGLYSQTAPEWVFELYLRTGGRWTFNTADLVFCYTDEEKHRLREYGVSTPVTVVPNGVDTTRFSPGGPGHDGLSGSPALLFVGRLVDGKRPATALEALDSVTDSYPNVTLTFCGTGPLRDDLERDATRRGLSGKVQFLGHVPYEEMPAIYRAVDALVLPSRTEGFPRTVLEALASDVPVVVSDLPQIRSLVSDGGETAPVDDGDAFAEAIATALTDDTLDPSGVVDNRFSWESTVERTTQALARLVAQ